MSQGHWLRCQEPLVIVTVATASKNSPACIHKTTTELIRTMEEYIIIPLSILSVMIVALNVFVCLLVCLKRQLQVSVTNRFIVSLAVSDILTGGVLFPVYLIKPDSIVTSYLVCIILLAGVANLCAVTYDRYIAVMKPLQYSYQIPKVFRRVIVISWTVPTIYSLLPLFWNTNPACTAHKVYIICLQFFGIIIPYIFISTTYYYIFRKVRRSFDLKRQLPTSRRETRRVSSEAKVARVFFIISAAFILCWLPIIYITTASVITTQEDIVPAALGHVSFFTMAMSSIVNPLMYSFMKPDFKLAILTLNCHNKGKRSGSRSIPLVAMEKGAIASDRVSSERVSGDKKCTHSRT